MMLRKTGVWCHEWVQDCWNTSYNGASTDGSTWMSGDCSLTVRRRGTWFTSGERLRSACRNWDPLDFRLFNRGFRVARSATP